MRRECDSRPSTHTPVVVATAVLAAASVIATLWLFSEKDRAFGNTAIDLVVEATAHLSSRPVDGRLSGGFSYQKAPVIGETPVLRRQGSRILALAAEIHRQTQHERTVENLRALAMCELLIGRAGQAVDALNTALSIDVSSVDFIGAMSESTNAALLNDLSVAYQARSNQRQTVLDAVISLEAAERSWNRRKTSEAAWNRAIAIQSFHMREDSVRAWEDYLSIDPTSAWAAEARRRVALLQTDRAADAWELDKTTLTRAAIQKDARTARAIVRRFPQQARTWGEEELLYDWAMATTRLDGPKAIQSLTIASVVADALFNVAGDATLRDAVAAIRKTGTALAPGHVQYHAAQELDRTQRRSEAKAAWQGAAVAFSNAGSPLWIRAAVFEATEFHLLGEGTMAAQQIAAILDDPALRKLYPSAVAQAFWLRALIRCSSGNQEEGIRDYRVALTLFEELRELENSAAVHTRLAANLGYIGRTNEGWQHRIEALRILDGYTNSSRTEPLLVDTARVIERSGFMLASLLFHDRLVRLAASDPTWRVEALRGRSVARWKTGQTKDALSDLQMAASAASAMPDANVRERATANVRSAEAIVFRATDPARAIEGATEALRFYQRVNNRLRIADLHMDRALAHGVRREFSMAVRDLDAAKEVLEQQRRNLRTPSERQVFLERRRTLFENGVALYVEHNDMDGAFSFGESTRARSILDALASSSENEGAAVGTTSSAAEMARRIPARTSLLWYGVLRNRLAIHVVRHGSTTGRVVQVSARHLQDLVAEASEACSSEDAERCRSASAVLYDILISPVRDVIEPNIVFVPDGMLHGVAVTALFDRAKRKYLIEDHEIVVAPSASAYLAHLARKEPQLADGVIIGNPAHNREVFPQLPTLAAAQVEAERLARLYPSAKLITGTSATKRALLDSGLRGAWIHYAGHIFYHTNAGQNALVLAPDHTNDSGRLTAAEIAQTKMTDVPLVVLSACGTWTTVDEGSGPLGFAEVFLRAGAHTVVATLSSVDDEMSSDVMLAFHDNFRLHHNAAAALREAQLRLLHDSDRKLRTPNVWSRFIVVV